MAFDPYIHDERRTMHPHLAHEALNRLAGIKISRTTVNSWTPEQCREAYDWAIASHQHKVETRARKPRRPPFVIPENF